MPSTEVEQPHIDESSPWQRLEMLSDEDLDWVFMYIFQKKFKQGGDMNASRCGDNA